MILYSLCKNSGLNGRIFILSLVACLSTLSPLESGADFYKYTDNSGVTYFVDSIDKIPLEYRDKSELIKEKSYDPLPTEERQTLLEKEKKAREEMIKGYFLKETETRVDILNNRVLVPVKIAYNNREIECILLLDTGASITVLYAATANQLGISQPSHFRGQLANGKIVDVGMAIVDYIMVGPLRKEHVKIAIVEHEGPATIHHGLLGMNFLSGFEYTIDFAQGIIRWKKP